VTEPIAERNAALLSWYRARHRPLAWRPVSDPYRVLVAEVMAQQTQAERAAAHYEQFVQRFPDAAALAAAPLGEVLALWSGLGYNVRAKRLRDAAAIVARDGWPRTVAGLQRLPGVGPYTAAAVACFAFGIPVPAVDTNLRRILGRWHGEPLDGAALQETAAAALGEPAADWNQAMMDLGAAVCRPRRPDCAACPVTEWCRAPGLEIPSPTQPRFSGSRRQVRGVVLRRIVGDPDGVTCDALVAASGRDQEYVIGVLEDLERDGLVERAGSRWHPAR
jgi:A/G-specific adenine glycosylase